MNPLSVLPKAFNTVLNISITASWIVLVVLIIRTIFRKAPKNTLCVLWGIAGLRLLFPIHIESIFSLMPSKETFAFREINPGNINPIPDAGSAPVISIVDNPVYSKVVSLEVSREAGQSFIKICGAVWLAGMLLMFCYAIVSTMILKKRVSASIPAERNVRECEFIDMPFLLGVFRPTIYLPYGLSDADKKVIISHENAHIKRKDHIWKPLGFVLLSVYWFNPVLWLGYVLLCRDIEAACDEIVISGLSPDERQDYSRTLLSCSIDRRRIAACPVAFGEGDVKERIKNIMSYKKPAVWIVTLSIIVCIALALCFLTNPKNTQAKNDFDDERDRNTETGSVILKNDELPGLEIKISWEKGKNDFVEIISKKSNICTIDANGYVRNAGFYDLNGDGKPELCYSSAKLTGHYMSAVAVCDVSDVKNIKQYKMDNAVAFDYFLDLSQNAPAVDIYTDRTDELYASGKLLLKGGKLFVDNGLQQFSDGSIADKDKLLAKYADRSKFGIPEEVDLVSKDNNIRSIIEDYFETEKRVLSSGISHEIIYHHSISEIAYVRAYFIEKMDDILRMDVLEDAVILQDINEYAVFWVSYSLLYENEDLGPQYPSGDYVREVVLGRTSEKDDWKVIALSAQTWKAIDLSAPAGL